MTAEQQLSHGIDLERLNEFLAHAAENPDAHWLGLGAAATYEGKAAHSLATVDSYEIDDETISRDTRAYTVPYGAWKEVLEAVGMVGATDRMEPVEAALSALAACINVGISVNAAANGVEIDRLKTHVRTDFDPRVLFSVDELRAADSAYQNLTAEIEIDGDELDQELIDEWARRAPVYTLVSLAQDVDIQIRTPAEVAGDD